MRQEGYRSDIDGLRAVAVLSVVLFHAGFPPFAGGFLGADVFFVISGFLITRRIKEQFEAGDFNFKSSTCGGRGGSCRHCSSPPLPAR